MNKVGWFDIVSLERMGNGLDLDLIQARYERRNLIHNDLVLDLKCSGTYQTCGILYILAYYLLTKH